MDRMRKNRKDNRAETAVIGENAVVIGSGIAGLAAARVLAERFTQVIVVDRDSAPSAKEIRSGAPQARHAHTLMPAGQAILERLFPGLVNQLLTCGAEPVDPLQDIRSYEGLEPKPTRPGPLRAAASRQLLEAAVYFRVRKLSNVVFYHGYEATGLDVRDGRVSGVYLRSRRQPQDPLGSLPADLVVDASGRNSKAAEWLAANGYEAPGASVVDAAAGYASRIYRRPSHLSLSWKSLYARPEPGEGNRGGVILPLEGDLWHVTLIGMAGDYPPTDEQGFLEFARSLPVPEFYQAIEAAEPLSRPVGFRKTENRLAHYDQLPAYLEGFLVMGDAVHTLNPVYALGMTTAVLGAKVLAQTLKRNAGIAGLAEKFQKDLGRAVDRFWQPVIQEDLRWPVTRTYEDRARPAHGSSWQPAAAPAFVGD